MGSLLTVTLFFIFFFFFFGSLFAFENLVFSAAQFGELLSLAKWDAS